MTDAEEVKRRLWLVGKVTDHQAKAWEFIGVFDDEPTAYRACRTAEYFIGPAELNKALPDETVEWTAAYYPLRLSAEVTDDD